MYLGTQSLGMIQIISKNLGYKFSKGFPSRTQKAQMHTRPKFHRPGFPRQRFERIGTP
jgi:hypothetical protein